MMQLSNRTVFCHALQNRGTKMEVGEVRGKGHTKEGDEHSKGEPNPKDLHCWHYCSALVPGVENML